MADWSSRAQRTRDLIADCRFGALRRDEISSEILADPRIVELSERLVADDDAGVRSAAAWLRERR
jgi:hypothetical protein